jgi:hypothetical protein
MIVQTVPFIVTWYIDYTGVHVKHNFFLQYHCRPGQALRVPGGWGSQISRQSAHEGGKFSALRTGRLTPRKYSWYSFLLETESIPGPQCSRKDYVNKKSQMTPSGIETATFRLVAQCINQLRYRVPPLTIHYKIKVTLLYKRINV